MGASIGNSVHALDRAGSRTIHGELGRGRVQGSRRLDSTTRTGRPEVRRLHGPLVSGRDEGRVSRVVPPELVRSGSAAAVRALDQGLREIRKALPSLEERQELLRERFEQARKQLFGNGGPDERAQAGIETVRGEPTRGALPLRDVADVLLGELRQAMSQRARDFVHELNPAASLTSARFQGEDVPTPENAGRLSNGMETILFPNRLRRGEVASTPVLDVRV